MGSGGLDVVLKDLRFELYNTLPFFFPNIFEYQPKARFGKPPAAPLEPHSSWCINDSTFAEVVWTVRMWSQAFLKKIICVQSGFPESLKVKNGESYQYIAGKKMWFDRDENLKDLRTINNSTMHRRGVQPLQNMWDTFTGIMVWTPGCRLGCFRPGRRSIWLLCDLESFPLKRAGEALEGRAAVKVRDPFSNWMSPCFLDQGGFAPKQCGAGDRLHQPACLLSFGWHFSWKVTSYRCVLYWYLFDMRQWCF